MVSIEEYPFIFMNTPASLLVLASAEIALMLWRRELANTKASDALKILHSKENLRCKNVLDVPVPRRIRAQIDKKIVGIGKELKEWINFLPNYDLLRSTTEAFFNCSKHIVADFSGSIDYKATAINILNSGEFNDAVNYKISCTFCLEDQVKRFWPAVANDPPTDTNSRYDECNLSYWNGLMKVGNSITDTELFKLQMMEAEAEAQTNSDLLLRGYVTTFEYFFKMLPDDARISKIISSLGRGCYCDQAVARILSTLDRVQAEKVFEQQASTIFKILMRNDNYFQFTHQLWTLMGHLVVEYESEFFYVVFGLWKMAFVPDSDDFTFTRCDQINGLLLEIWSNASDELKAYVSDVFLRKYRTVATYCRDNFASYYGHDMSFMLEIMSKSTYVDKEHLWQQNWKELLALRAKPLYLEQFMRICLLSDDEIELFKKKFADFGNLFESLIEAGFYSDLKDCLLFCSKDAKQFHVLGKEVLGSNLQFILLHDGDKFAKFDWFVGEVFANVKKDAEEFKTQMISSGVCLQHLIDARQDDEISSKDFSRIIGRFVNNEEELQLVKRKLLEQCRTYPVNYEYTDTTETFNADQWQEFLEWCTADHEEISAFKRSLNVDLIFLERLRSYLNLECPFDDLDFLDNFLNWYFGNEEDAKNFKLDKIKNYKQIDVLRVEMETRSIIYVNGEMYELLKWLFDDNEENVDEFCASCNCSLRIPPRRRVHPRKQYGCCIPRESVNFRKKKWL